LTASKLSIRPFRPDDLPAMQLVRQAAFEPVFQSFREIVGERIYSLALTTADAEQAKLLDDLCSANSGQVLVAAIEGRVVGFVSFTLNVEKRTGEIGLNAVHPDFAGQGIGTRMYEFVMARMKQSGMALATVSTGADASHASARRAYEKAGGRIERVHFPGAAHSFIQRPGADTDKCIALMREFVGKCAREKGRRRGA